MDGMQTEEQFVGALTIGVVSEDDADIEKNKISPEVQEEPSAVINCICCGNRKESNPIRVSNQEACLVTQFGGN